MSKIIELEELQAALKTETSSNIEILMQIFFLIMIVTERFVRGFVNFLCFHSKPEYDEKNRKIKIAFSLNKLITTYNDLYTYNSGLYDEIDGKICLYDLNVLRANIFH